MATQLKSPLRHNETSPKNETLFPTSPTFLCEGRSQPAVVKNCAFAISLHLIPTFLHLFGFCLQPAKEECDRWPAHIPCSFLCGQKNQWRAWYKSSTELTRLFFHHSLNVSASWTCWPGRLQPQKDTYVELDEGAFCAPTNKSSHPCDTNRGCHLSWLLGG